MYLTIQRVKTTNLQQWKLKSIYTFSINNIEKNQEMCYTSRVEVELVEDASTKRHPLYKFARMPTPVVSTISSRKKGKYTW